MECKKVTVKRREYVGGGEGTVDEVRQGKLRNHGAAVPSEGEAGPCVRGDAEASNGCCG